jgi:hypothetical protein
VTDSTVRECSATGDPIGIVLGKPSGIVVVDIDVQHGVYAENPVTITRTRFANC